MKTTKLFTLFLMATMFCFFIPSFALAVGAGIEPGDSCGLEGAKYDGPPLIGDVTLTIVEGDLVAVGIFERNGNQGCAFSANIVLGPITTEDFNELIAKDIKNFCLDEIIGISSECDDLSDEQPYEVIAVGAFKRLYPADNAYSAKLIIMPLILQ